MSGKQVFLRSYGRQHHHQDSVILTVSTIAQSPWVNSGYLVWIVRSFVPCWAGTWIGHSALMSPTISLSVDTTNVVTWVSWLIIVFARLKLHTDLCVKLQGWRQASFQSVSLVMSGLHKHYTTLLTGVSSVAHIQPWVIFSNTILGQKAVSSLQLFLGPEITDWNL